LQHSALATNVLIDFTNVIAIQSLLHILFGMEDHSGWAYDKEVIHPGKPDE
jgi:hypothetical protein